MNEASNIIDFFVVISVFTVRLNHIGFLVDSENDKVEQVIIDGQIAYKNGCGTNFRAGMKFIKDFGKI